MSLTRRAVPGHVRRTVLTATTGLLLATTGCGSDDAAPSRSPGTTAGAPSAAPTTTSTRTTVPPAAAERVRREIGRLERSLDGRIGAYAIDTGSGREVDHLGDDRFPLHSTFKAFVAAAIVARARTDDPGLLQRRVRWTTGDVLDNSPVTDEHLEDGMTVAELCAATVATSDNTAANLLLRELGGPSSLTRYFRSIGDGVSRMDRYEPSASWWSPGEAHDTTTPRAAATDVRRVALDGPAPVADRRRVLGWLRASTTGATRIQAGLPKRWTVASKTGTGFTHGSANDVAIIWPGGGRAPLLMAVYTYRDDRDADGDDAVLAKTATILARGLGALE